jgi:hypothetical protein
MSWYLASLLASVKLGPSESRVEHLAFAVQAAVVEPQMGLIIEPIHVPTNRFRRGSKPSVICVYALPAAGHVAGAVADDPELAERTRSLRAAEDLRRFRRARRRDVCSYAQSPTSCWSHSLLLLGFGELHLRVTPS